LGYNKGFADTTVIPSHSHIFGAWVEAGLLGAVFWGWILYFLIKSLLRLVSTRAAIASLLAFFCFGLVWSILFSPYGAETRFIETYQIASIMAFLAFQTIHKKA
jgi:O-antigen ligase